MSTAVAGRTPINVGRDKIAERSPVIARMVQSVATLLMLLVAVELTFGFMACYYSCAARKALAEDKKLAEGHFVAEGLPDISSIVDADQLVNLDQIVTDIPIEAPDYAYFCEESCNSDDKDLELMHEKMPFGSNFMTPCEVLENVKTLSLGNAFAGGHKNVTILDHFIDFLERLREKYESLNEMDSADNGEDDENAMVNFDQVDYVAAS